MCWAMIFVMACRSSLTDDYTHNLSITRVLWAELWYLSWRVVVKLQTIKHTISALHGYYVLSYDICHGVWLLSYRRLYTQSQHYTGIMCWAMIFVMACGCKVRDNYTHNLSITRVLCVELWYLSWRVVVKLQTIIHNLSITRVLCVELWYLSWRVVVKLQTIIHTTPALHGYYVLSYDICHGVWLLSYRRLYTQSQHYTGIMCWAMIFVMACDC